MRSLLLVLALAGGALAQVADITAQNFVTIVNGERPCVLLFYVPWCPDCHTFMPKYEAVSSQLSAAGITAARVNGEDEPGIKDRYKVSEFPDIKLIRQNGSPEDYPGDLEGAELLQWAVKAAQGGGSSVAPAAPVVGNSPLSSTAVPPASWPTDSQGNPDFQAMLNKMMNNAGNADVQADKQKAAQAEAERQQARAQQQPKSETEIAQNAAFDDSIQDAVTAENAKAAQVTLEKLQYTNWYNNVVQQQEQQKKQVLGNLLSTGPMAAFMHMIPQVATTPESQKLVSKVESNVESLTDQQFDKMMDDSNENRVPDILALMFGLSDSTKKEVKKNYENLMAKGENLMGMANMMNPGMQGGSVNAMGATF